MCVCVVGGACCGTVKEGAILDTLASVCLRSSVFCFPADTCWAASLAAGRVKQEATCKLILQESLRAEESSVPVPCGKTPHLPAHMAGAED